MDKIINKIKLYANKNRFTKDVIQENRWKRRL
jgi:hypothetical protein